MHEKKNSGVREAMDVDVVIVGAGPAGLATACKILQLSQGSNHPLSVVVLEKGSEVGAHILSGAVIETTALDNLFPDWRQSDIPMTTSVNCDEIYFYGKSNKLKWPVSLAPKTMHNDGNYIGSLGRLVKWLGDRAEQLGADIYPGFAASEVLILSLIHI